MINERQQILVPRKSKGKFAPLPDGRFVCTTCGKPKHKSEFRGCKKSSDGIRKKCKQCHSEYETNLYRTSPSRKAKQQETSYKWIKDRPGYQRDLKKQKEERIQELVRTGVLRPVSMTSVDRMLKNA